MTPMTRMVTHTETAAFFDGGDSLDLTVERVHFTSGDIRKEWSEATVLLNGVSTTIKAPRTVDAIETVSKAIRFVGEATNDQSVIGLASEVLAFGFNNYKRFVNLDTARETVTVTVSRGDTDITVEMEWTGSKWAPVQVLDEDGNTVALTVDEIVHAIDLAESGVDESGM